MPQSDSEGRQVQGEVWAEVGWVAADAEPWQRFFALPPGYDGDLGPSWREQELEIARECREWRELGFSADEAKRWRGSLAGTSMVAERWRDAGLSFEAASHWFWLVEGDAIHSLDDALVWATSGLAAGEALRWHWLVDQGLITSAEEAREWERSGLSLGQARLALRAKEPLSRVGGYSDEEWAALELVAAFPADAAD